MGKERSSGLAGEETRTRVKRPSGRIYRCPSCGLILDVAGNDQPREVLVAMSGSPNRSAVICSGREIHRCDFKVHRQQP
jgi:hypothetical protein